MSADRGFELHPGAAQDITEIWQFIAERNVSAAAEFREEIIRAIGNLATFPNQGHRRPDLTSRPLRFQTVRDYLIVYAPDEVPLVVVAVIHGRRSPRVMAALLRGRE